MNTMVHPDRNPHLYNDDDKQKRRLESCFAAAIAKFPPVILLTILRAFLFLRAIFHTFSKGAVPAQETVPSVRSLDNLFSCDRQQQAQEIRLNYGELNNRLSQSWPTLARYCRIHLCQLSSCKKLGRRLDCHHDVSGRLPKMEPSMF